MHVDLDILHRLFVSLFSQVELIHFSDVLLSLRMDSGNLVELLIQCFADSFEISHAFLVMIIKCVVVLL